MTELKNYPAVVNGKETILRLSEKDAKTRGLSRTVTVAELSAKSRVPANKAAAAPSDKAGTAPADAAAAEAAAKDAAAAEAAAKEAAAAEAAGKTAAAAKTTATAKTDK